MIKLNKIIFFLLITSYSFSQNLKKDEFILNGNTYKERSNYALIGYGIGSNSNLNEQEENIMVSYNFYIKKWLFNAGYHFSSNKFFLRRTNQRLSDFFVGIAKRIESVHSNWDISGGPSFCYGASKRDDGYYYGFEKMGFVGRLSYTYKIFYDVGIGASVYASYDKYYSVQGINFHIYFSNALRQNK